MKKTAIFILFLVTSIGAYSQDVYLTLNGGYAHANLSDSKTDGNGYKINGVYEIRPQDGPLTLGVTLGYLHLTGSNGSRNYKVGSVPFYFSPKYLFGNQKIKVYLKGAFGGQFSSMATTGTSVDYTDHDFGIVAGGGTGLMYFVSEKVFVNAEYEILWVSNDYYSDGWTNSFTAGVGLRF